MTTFEDGPAKDKTFILRRSPLFLRVVQQQDEWDALDLIDDQPQENESIFVYERNGKPGACFIDGPKVSGLYATARYRLLHPPFPLDDELRDNEAWQKWCIQRKAAQSTCA